MKWSEIINFPQYISLKDFTMALTESCQDLVQKSDFTDITMALTRFSVVQNVRKR